MKTPLIIILVIIGIIFAGSVLLMAPKGGLGSALGGIGGGDEYGSKKSLEGKLKKIALVSAILFVVIVLVLPYVD